jgi:FkbM family methyltransferase
MNQNLAKMSKHIYNYTLKLACENQLKKSYEKFSQLSSEEATVTLDLKKLGIPHNPELFINPEDKGLSAQLYAWGFREPVNTVCIYNFLRREKNKIDALIDIGANIGYFSVIAHISQIENIIAIEPVPQTFDVLTKNTKKRKIRAFNIAISNKTGKIKMYIPDKFNLATPISSEINGKTLKNIVTVEAKSIEEIIKQENLESSNVVLRMDIEGYEKKVIDALPDNIYALLFEFHIPILGVKNSKQFLRTLKNKGFNIEYLVDNPKGYEQIVKYTTFKTYLKLFEMIGKKRLHYRPKQLVLDKLIEAGKACPEIIAVLS